jgi:hypothetical protein
MRPLRRGRTECICELIAKGVESMPPMIPADWDESILLRLEDETVIITFKDGNVLLKVGDLSDAESIIQMTKKRLCEMIDGTIDFMTVWRELAEPSPTDSRYILKGNGAKLITLIDLLSRSFKSHPEFNQLLMEYKKNL